MSRWQNPFYAMNDYQLNLEKSLEKKLIAAKRVKSLNYKYTGGGIVVEVDVAIYVLHYTGGGIVVEVDVAIYVLLKTAAVYFYQLYPDKDVKADITNVTDKTRKNIIQVTTRLSDRQSQSGGYTINFYHTTSKKLVNGENVSKFIDEDVSSIQKIITENLKDNRSSDVKAVNEMMKTQLVVLLKIMRKTKQSASSGANEPVGDAENIVCNKCKRACRTRSLYCDLGMRWTHYKCEKLSTTEIAAIEQDNKGNNKITELRTILQRESQNS